MVLDTSPTFQTPIPIRASCGQEKGKKGPPPSPLARKGVGTLFTFHVSNQQRLLLPAIIDSITRPQSRPVRSLCHRASIRNLGTEDCRVSSNGTEADSSLQTRATPSGKRSTITRNDRSVSKRPANLSFGITIFIRNRPCGSQTAARDQGYAAWDRFFAAGADTHVATRVCCEDHLHVSLTSICQYPVNDCEVHRVHLSRLIGPHCPLFYKLLYPSSFFPPYLEPVKPPSNAPPYYSFI